MAVNAINVSQASGISPIAKCVNAMGIVKPAIHTPANVFHVKSSQAATIVIAASRASTGTRCLAARSGVGHAVAQTPWLQVIRMPTNVS